MPTLDIRFPDIGEREVAAAPAPVPNEAPRRLRKDALHQAIRDKVWQQFEHGHFDTAVFEAMKAVEVAVREAAQYSDSDYGTDMIARAFHEDKGPLRDPNALPAERIARRNLFVGAHGSY